ncbi:hypothetical protein P3L10_009795 [Capsicum annuum]
MPEPHAFGCHKVHFVIWVGHRTGFFGEAALTRNHYNGRRWYRACSWDTCNDLYTGACAHGADVAVNRRNSPKFWFHRKG